MKSFSRYAVSIITIPVGAKPSMDDIEVNRKLCKSCDIVGINVLDHIIVGCEGYFSFKQKQMI